MESLETIGFEDFSRNAADAGVDGIILVDLSLEKSFILRSYLDSTRM